MTMTPEKVLDRLLALAAMGGNYPLLSADLVDQETLFAIQGEFSQLLVDLASSCDRTADLVRLFPWAFQVVADDLNEGDSDG